MHLKDFFRIMLSSKNKLSSKERIYSIEFKLMFGCLFSLILALMLFLIYKSIRSIIYGSSIFMLTFILLEIYSFHAFNIESINGNPSDLVYYNYILFGFFLLIFIFLKSV